MDKSQEIIFEKGSQMGVSTYSLIWAFWLAKTQQARRGIIYWLPTDSDVGDFVNTKVDPFINDNDELIENKSLIPGKMTDNQGLKFLYQTPLFFRGLKSKTKVKSISADVSIFDEFDEAEPAQVAQARKRTSASLVKLSRELSTPTIPDFGINQRFNESDQCYYGFRCGACGRFNILEQDFPNCFQQDPQGNYYHACGNHRCKAKLDVSQGQWAQVNHRAQLRGYHISQLYSPFVSPNEIMKEYQQTNFMGHFMNHVIGVPYLSATDQVTKEMVFSLCNPLRKNAAGSTKPTVMGCDVGSKLHYVILGKDNIEQVISIGECLTFKELETLMIKFNVKALVIDALPETRKVRELIADNKNRVWACFYNEHQKGSYGWNEEERIVTVNRTESLDAGQDTIIKQLVSLPQRDKMIEEFAQHCANLVKIPEENEETGAVRYVYKKLGPDHFRHAYNYAKIALSRSSKASTMSVTR